MKKAVFLVAFVTAGCASSAWERTEAVPGGRLYIPKVYAPLLPGSIYPDKKAPVPAKARPTLILICPPKSDCRKDEILARAAERRLVVFVPKGPDTLLSLRLEADDARTGTLIVAATSLKVEVLPPPRAGASPSSRSQKVLFETLQSTASAARPDGAILKLYAPDARGRLPREAFRDAVEWLAGELGAR